MAKKTHEKMLTIFDQKGNANLNLTSVRIATIKNTNNNYWQRCREKGTLIHCWWEYELVQPL
jgi:hypothetical protein